MTRSPLEHWFKFVRAKWLNKTEVAGGKVKIEMTKFVKSGLAFLGSKSFAVKSNTSGFETVNNWRDTISVITDLEYARVLVLDSAYLFAHLCCLSCVKQVDNIRHLAK